MKQTAALWTGLLLGPAIWFLSLEAKFALAPTVCGLNWKPAIYVVSVIAILITAGAGFLSWSQLRELNRRELKPPADAPALSRARAMAIGGVAMNAALIIVLLAQSLPELILRGCE